MLSDLCVLECEELSRRAEVLTRGSKADREEAAVLLNRIALRTKTERSSSEIEAQYAIAKTDSLSRSFRGRAVVVNPMDERRYVSAFTNWLRTSPRAVNADRAEAELRSASEMLGRPTGINYSNAGGYIVPPVFSDKFFKGVAQYDPLLDPTAVTLDKEEGYTFSGKAYPGWDLSTFAAVRINSTNGNDGQAVQQNPQTIPLASASFLSGFVYRASLAATYELFTDAGEDYLMDKISAAYSVAMARAIGVDLVNGSGSPTQPSGILTGAVDSGLTIGTGSEEAGSQPSGNVTAADLVKLYFSLNRIHRANPKAAFVMADETYQQIRLATDNMSRPLIHVSEDGEMLFGKRILIAPSMPYYIASPVSDGKIIFGNLSAFLVRCTSLVISKSTESGQANIDKGEYLLNGRMRADAVVVDPTNGSVPPIVVANVA